MQFTYYPKFDPRSFGSPIKNDKDLLNLLGSPGEPASIHFTNFQYDSRITIRRDVVLSGNIKAKFLLVDGANVTFRNAKVKPFDKDQNDHYGSITQSSNFEGQLMIDNSVISSPGQGKMAVDSMISDNGTFPQLLTISNSKIQGLMVAPISAELIGEIDLANPTDSAQNVLNVLGHLETSNVNLKLDSIMLMNSGKAADIDTITLLNGPVTLTGNYNIKNMIIDSKKKSLELFVVDGERYETELQLENLRVNRIPKGSSAIYLKNATLKATNAKLGDVSNNNVTASAIDSNLIFKGTQDNLSWHVAGKSEIDLLNSTSSLELLAPNFPPSKPQSLTGENADSNTTVSKSGEKSGSQKLQELIGLASVKEMLTKFINNTIIDKERRERGLGGVEGLSRHMIFAGNPGTGKTTVAKIVAEILHENGALPTNKVKTILASGLIDDKVGGSALKAQEVLQESLGGVLFIDEAYELNENLVGNAFTGQVVQELMTTMEEHRDDLIVILAGYTKQMDELLETGNPGFRSRFTNYIEFEDYTLDEKLQITKYSIKAQNAVMDESFYEHKNFRKLLQFYGRHNANARDVRNFVQALLIARDNRLAKTPMDKLTNDDLMRITAEDFKEVWNDAIETQKREKAASNINYESKW